MRGAVGELICTFVEFIAGMAFCPAPGDASGRGVTLDRGHQRLPEVAILDRMPRRRYSLSVKISI